MTRRRWLLGLGAGAALGAAGYFSIRRKFPSDKLPEGAWARIAFAVYNQRLEDAFAYLETEAQWACFSIGESSAKALSLITAFPAEEQPPLRARYELFGAHPDGPEVFALYGKEHGFLPRLKKDLSGTHHSEVDGERATVVTARGTRLPFRRRENGIWGLTIFSAELLAESRRIARDLEAMDRSAQDFVRRRGIAVDGEVKTGRVRP